MIVSSCIHMRYIRELSTTFFAQRSEPLIAPEMLVSLWAVTVFHGRPATRLLLRDFLSLGDGLGPPEDALQLSARFARNDMSPFLWGVI